jgi:alkylation response protein AidB-like acyl-CoA dehydrogenase
MSRASTESQHLSFAETALRMSGKTEEEARRTGAVDKADDQVEALFAPQYQTVHSPVHRAVWEAQVPLDLFSAPQLAPSHPCDAAMARSLEIVKTRRQNGTLYDEKGKVSGSLIEELGRAGYWSMLIDERYGGQAAPFARFADFLTKMATLDPVTAGLASVHGCIGAVDPVRTFGNLEQKDRFLPRLASGQALSGFALTEPCAGSDLTALRTTAVAVGDHFEVTGEKLFITNAIPGRTIGLVVILEGKPAVLIVELPLCENEHFQIVHYGLHALRNSHNNGLRFNCFRVPRANLLVPPVGDGLTIAYHGLNLGRLALCANASGTMRILLANILPWADFRHTYGQLINTRELVKRRIARLAALIVGCDALTAWGSWLIDQGYRGELECVIAKIFASEALKEAAVELFMKTHGGRSFLHGHLFGDNVYDLLAPCIYEGEGEMLGLAFFKSLVKHHGLTYFEPIGRALQREQIHHFNPLNPRHAWALRRELGAYARWSLGLRLAARGSTAKPAAHGRFAQHVRFAIARFGYFAVEISSTMRKYQLKLADRQCRMAEISRRVQNTVVLLVTALWGGWQKEEACLAAADVLCQDLRRELTGERPSDAYYRDCSRLADLVISGDFAALVSAPRGEILMPYQKSPVM